MKKIYLIISSISLALLLSACGGGDAVDSANGSTSISIVMCDTNTTTPLQSGDTIVKDTDNTTLTITDIDQTSKTVCVDAGSAHIVR